MNIVFQNESTIDENNNFVIEFRIKVDTDIGNEMEKYLLKKKKALVIVHEKNFDKLTPGEKNLATIILDANQRIRINQRSWVFLCFPPNSNFHRQFRKNDFRHFCTYKGPV